MDRRIVLYLLEYCIFASESCLLLFPFVSDPLFPLKSTFSPLNQFNYKPLHRDQFKVAEKGEKKREGECGETDRKTCAANRSWK